MTAATLTLADFLLQRIAEDEAQAKVLGVAEVVAPNDLVAFMDPDTTTLIISPTRVLAECAAKRAIVELHEMVTEDYRGQWWVSDQTDDELIVTGCRYCTHAGVDGESYLNPGPCATLRALALPYADHPAFRDEWRP